jgi:hypothetical protein
MPSRARATRAFAAAVVTALVIAGCSLMGTTAPSKAAPAQPTQDVPQPTPTISIAQLAKDYLVVAGDSNDAHATLRAHCSGNLTLKQQRDCYAREAVIEQNLLKAYSELKVPPELDADFAALRNAVAAYEALLRQGAAAKTASAIKAAAVKIDKGSCAVTAAAIKIRADLHLPAIKGC